MQDTRFTREQMKEAFDMVADRNHWKNPIKRIVKIEPRMIPIIEDAVMYFTGSEAEITKLHSGFYRVEAVGYYSAIGA